MQVRNFTRTINQDKTRVAATIIWENCDRPEEEIFFETTAEFGQDLVINPDAWLLACALPAMRYGEERITLDAPISPEIRDGLINAMRCLIDWHGGARKVISIEAVTRSVPLFSTQSKRAAGFFDGGINALAMLQDNHHNFYSGHPRRIQDGILVTGIFDAPPEVSLDLQDVDSISNIAQDAELEVILVTTNAYSHLRDLDLDLSFWRCEYMGAFFAAIAHAFIPRLASASIASSHNYANLGAWGSHPLLDPLYSSNSLQIRHENLALSRLEKVRLLEEWDVALQHLRICDSQANDQNCGKCQKCVTTMTEFLALGLLKQIPTFPEQDVSPELLLNSCKVNHIYDRHCYQELIEPLSQIGRQDLVNSLEQIISQDCQSNVTNRFQLPDRKTILKKLLNLLFNGQLP